MVHTAKPPKKARVLYLKIYLQKLWTKIMKTSTNTVRYCALWQENSLGFGDLFLSRLLELQAYVVKKLTEITFVQL